MLDNALYLRSSNFLTCGLILTFVCWSAGDALGQGAGSNSGSEPANVQNNEKRVAQTWMDELLSNSKAVSGVARFQRFSDPYYIVLESISWSPNEADSKLPTVVVPSGFVTDLASVPQLFWTSLRPDGEYAYAAVIHDYLYWEQKFPRETADKVFLEAMKDFRINSPTAQLIYRAVRLDAAGLGGGPAWREFSKAKKSGEKRVLRKFPENPLISWSEWRKEPGVFR